jgi:aminoglycoside N3'-acetyltransferase
VDTALFTTFTRPYIFLGGPNRNWRYRPFDPADADAVWTGTVGKTVLRKFPDAVRSRHITHSWAGFGSRAHACLDAHGPCDPPAGETSPLAKALELGGKILYFGAGLESTTFIHFLEDATHMPFLSTAICRVKMPNGELDTVAVPRHLPGCREFYTDAMECKFFRRAFARGLELKRVKLGMGELMLLDIRQLYDIGMAVIKEDPKILLCDSPDCLFCRQYR